MRRPPFSRINGNVMALCGVFAALGFVLAPDWRFRLAGAGLALVSALLSGRRVRWGTTLVTFFTFLLLHQLAPEGRIILSLGTLRFTQGALFRGIDRASLFTGLIYISRTSVRPPLNFSGRMGGLVAKIFAGWERISEEPLWGTGLSVERRLDAILLKLDEIPVQPSKEEAVGNVVWPGAVWAALFWAGPLVSVISVI